MQEVVRVELVPLMVPAHPDVYATNRNTVERLGKLGQIDPSTGHIPDLMQRGWLARVNGTEVPVVAYGIEPADGGAQALVSLVVAADSVQVGDPSVGTTAPPVRPAVPEPKSVSTWGSATKDPREGIPGWEPDTAAVSLDFDGHPIHGDHLLRELREQIKRHGRDGIAGVTA
jgi:hypothetical protein